MPQTTENLGRPFMYAFSLHVLLAVFFALVPLNSSPPAKEYFEVALAHTPSWGSEDNIDDLNRRRRQRLDGSARESASRVVLPERRMLVDDDQVTVPAFDEKLLDESRGDVGGKITQADYDQEERDWKVTGSDQSAGKRGVREFEEAETNRSRIFVFGSRQGTDQTGYRLDWLTGGDRKIINMVKPAYPAGIHRELKISLTFLVLPDGSVERVLPMRKGDPRLEEATLKAFRQWKFESLSSGSGQTAQQGRITFIFKLK